MARPRAGRAAAFALLAGLTFYPARRAKRRAGLFLLIVFRKFRVSEGPLTHRRNVPPLPLHIQQPQGRQCVEAFRPTSRGSGVPARRPDHRRMTRRVRAFIRSSCALCSARVLPSIIWISQWGCL